MSTTTRSPAHAHGSPRRASRVRARARLLAGSKRRVRPRYDINPLVARLLGILGVVLLSPLLYVAAWVLMPNEAGGTTAGESPT